MPKKKRDTRGLVETKELTPEEILKILKHRDDLKKSPDYCTCDDYCPKCGKVKRPPQGVPYQVPYSPQPADPWYKPYIIYTSTGTKF